MIKSLKKRYLIVLGILVFTLGFVALRRVSPFRQPPPAPEQEEQPIQDNIISVSGSIQAENVANLTFQTSGLLTWVGVKQGDYVKRYQGIASLDQRQLKNNLNKSLNNYMTNRWDFEQTQDNYKDKRDRSLLTDQDKRVLEKAQFSLNNAVIDVEQADLAKRLSFIFSPITGIVTRIDTPIAGVNVTPISTFTVVDPSSVYFSAYVDEADIREIRVGQEVIINLDSYPDDQFVGRIESIAFVASATAGGGTAFEVKISLPKNENLKLKVGMNGDAEITVK